MTKTGVRAAENTPEEKILAARVVCDRASRQHPLDDHAARAEAELLLDALGLDALELVHIAMPAPRPTAPALAPTPAPPRPRRCTPDERRILGLTIHNLVRRDPLAHWRTPSGRDVSDIIRDLCQLGYARLDYDRPDDGPVELFVTEAGEAQLDQNRGPRR